MKLEGQRATPLWPGMKNGILIMSSFTSSTSSTLFTLHSNSWSYIAEEKLNELFLLNNFSSIPLLQDCFIIPKRSTKSLNE